MIKRRIAQISTSLLVLSLGCRAAERESQDDPWEGAGDDDDDGAGGEDDDGMKLDASGGDDHSSGPAHDAEWSYIWIANSKEGTVSKIHTDTMVEEARYITRPDGIGDPSRTSVSLTGDAAVANREGGITKYFADPEDCLDSNGTPGIQTSTGSSPLPWDEEECRAWYVPMDYNSQRAVAWTGKIDGDGGVYDQNLWVTGAKDGSRVVDIHLLNGSDGSTKGTAHLDFDALDVTLGPWFDPADWGQYGGAVDGKGNFWFTSLAQGYLARVNMADMSVDVFDKPIDTYGIAVDPKGRVWACRKIIGRFDPATEIWDVVGTVDGGTAQYPNVNIIAMDPTFGLPNVREGNGTGSGCMMDGNGILWASGASANGALPHVVLGIDGETMEGVQAIEVAGEPKGISVDFEGRIWSVTNLGSTAYRVDPETEQVDEFAGLNQAYTYSDMTGFMLASNSDPIE